MIEPAQGVRVPQQRRSRESLERALAAGIELLGEGGYEALTIAEVSRRASVSIGSIYDRFGSKDGLFHALQARVLSAIENEHRARMEREAWEDHPTDELIRAAVRIFAEVSYAHGPLLRAMIQRSTLDQAVLARGSRTSSELAVQFETLLMTRRGDIVHPQPELAADVCFRLVYAAVTRRITHGPTFESPHEIDWGTLVRELGEVCVAYLLGRA
jgi:AcrR family transcriptional regulator